MKNNKWNKRCLSTFIIIIALIANIGLLETVSAENVIFEDDFDSYTQGVFPSSGGWNLKYNGAGNAYQIVDNSKSVSPQNSLKLEGVSGWAAAADHSLSETPDIVMFEADILVNRPDGGTSGWVNAYVAIIDPDISWGKNYCMVAFSADKKIDWKIPYNFDQWYHIKGKANMIERKCEIWVDGQSIGINDIAPDGYYKSIRLDSDNPAYTRAWFDNVKVYEETTEQQIPEFQTLALPIICVISLMLFFRRRKGK